MASEPLPVMHAGEVPRPETTAAWLVDGLWGRGAVGIVGGAPKCCKTWLALDLAVSVASGTPALGRFAVREAGSVLLYCAEDAPAYIASRLEGIASARGLDVRDMDLQLIMAPSLRLDTARDLDRLRATLSAYQTRLLVLDPLVRLHRLDENSAGDVSGLLGELRALQREHGLAILIVHHLRKHLAPRGQDGQSLRGSGDLHAWGDSNLYLRRRDRHLVLTVEHRSAPAPTPCNVELALEPAPHLQVMEPADSPQVVSDLERKVVEALASGPLDRETLRQRVHARNSTLGEVLVRLRSHRRIERAAGGFRLPNPTQHPIPVPTPMNKPERNAPPTDWRLTPPGG